MSTKNKQNIPAWLIALIIALIALNGYQWFSNNQLKEVAEIQESERLQLEKINTELDQDYQASLESLESLKTDNESLNQLIDNQKNELKAQKDKINNLIWTKRELGKAKTEIDKFKSLTEQYIAEINTLKTENKELYASNQILTTEKRVLSEEIERTSQLNLQLEETKKALAAEKAKLDENNVVLSTKVDMAEAIKINFIKVEGYQVKDDGKLKKKGKAKQIDMIRTCYKTETNMVAQKGPKEFFVRLISPLGETLAIESAGSGVLTDKLTGQKIKYSAKGAIDYQQQDSEGCIDFYTSFKIPKGEYKVEIYNNSFMVGKGDFKFK